MPARPAKNATTANTGKKAKTPVKGSILKARRQQIVSDERKDRARSGASSQAVKPETPARSRRGLGASSQAVKPKNSKVNRMDEDTVLENEMTSHSPTKESSSGEESSSDKKESSSGEESSSDKKESSSGEESGDDIDPTKKMVEDGEQVDGKHDSLKNCGAHNGKGKGDVKKAAKKYSDNFKKCREIAEGIGRTKKDGSNAKLHIHAPSAISACSFMMERVALAKSDVPLKHVEFMTGFVAKYNFELDANKSVDSEISFKPISTLTYSKIRSLNAILLTFLQRFVDMCSAAYHAAMHDPQFAYVKPPKNTNGKKRRTREAGISAQYVTNVSNSFENMNDDQLEALMQKLADVKRKAAASVAAPAAMEAE